MPDWEALLDAAESSQSLTSVQVPVKDYKRVELKTLKEWRQYADVYNEEQKWKQGELPVDAVECLVPTTLELAREHWRRFPGMDLLPDEALEGLLEYLQELKQPGSTEPTPAELWIAMCRPKFGGATEQQRAFIIRPDVVPAGYSISQYYSQLNTIGKLREAGWSDSQLKGYFLDGLGGNSRFRGVATEAEREARLTDRGKRGELTALQVYNLVERHYRAFHKDCSMYLSGRQDAAALKKIEQYWGKESVAAQLEYMRAVQPVGEKKPVVPVTQYRPPAKPQYRGDHRTATGAQASMGTADSGAREDYGPAVASCQLCMQPGHTAQRCFCLHPHLIRNRYTPDVNGPGFPILVQTVRRMSVQDRNAVMEKLDLPPEIKADILRGVQVHGAAAAVGRQQPQQPRQRNRQQQPQQRPQQQHQQQQQQQQQPREPAIAAVAAEMAGLQLPTFQDPTIRPIAYSAVVYHDMAARPHALMAFETVVEPEYDDPLPTWQDTGAIAATPLALMADAEGPVVEPQPQTAMAATRSRTVREAAAREPREPAATELQEPVATEPQEPAATELQEPVATEPQEPAAAGPAGAAAPPAQGAARIVPFTPALLGPTVVPPRIGQQGRRRQPGGDVAMPGGLPIPTSGGGMAVESPALPTTEATVYLPLTHITDKDPESEASKLLKCVKSACITFGTGQSGIISADALLLVLPLSAYESFLNIIQQRGTLGASAAAASARVHAALGRWQSQQTPVEAAEYLKALTGNCPTVFRVERRGMGFEEMAKGISLRGPKGLYVAIDSAGIDSGCNILYLPEAILKQLGIALLPSNTTVGQAAGHDEPVSGVPAEPITISLGKGTPAHVELEVKRVYVCKRLGAGVRILIGTEILNRVVSVLDLRPPHATWRYYSRFPTTGQVGGEPDGAIRLQVFHPTEPLTVGLLSQVPAQSSLASCEHCLSTAPVAMMSDVGSVGEEAFSPSLAGEGALPSWQERAVTAAALHVGSELQEAFLEGRLRPDLAGVEEPPAWEQLVPQALRTLEQYREQHDGRPFQPEPQQRVSGSRFQELWRPQPMAHGLLVDWDDTQTPTRPGLGPIPLAARLEFRWQAAARALLSPDRRGDYGIPQFTREQYEEADIQVAWRYALATLYITAYQQYVERYLEQGERWSLAQVDDDSLEAQLWPFQRAQLYTGVGPATIGELEAAVGREMQGYSMTWGLRGQGVPAWDQSGLQGKPDFFEPLEDQGYREQLGESQAEWVREQLSARWRYTAVMHAMYGDSPAKTVNAATWNSMSLRERVQLRQEVKYFRAYEEWIRVQQGKANSLTGEHRALHLFNPASMGNAFEEQPPSPAWAYQYMQVAAAEEGLPKPPLSTLWVLRDRSRASRAGLLAGSTQDWQWDYPIAGGSMSAPLCVMAAAAMQEPRRWAWVMGRQSDPVYNGAWSECTVEEKRAAYLRQLYRTVWQARIDHGVRMAHTPGNLVPAFSTSPARSEEGSVEFWATPGTSTPVAQQYGWGQVLGLGGAVSPQEESQTAGSPSSSSAERRPGTSGTLASHRPASMPQDPQIELIALQMQQLGQQFEQLLQRAAARPQQ
jgi:hypothetical protein